MLLGFFPTEMVWPVFIAHFGQYSSFEWLCTILHICISSYAKLHVSYILKKYEQKEAYLLESNLRNESLKASLNAPVL